MLLNENISLSHFPAKFLNFYFYYFIKGIMLTGKGVMLTGVDVI